MKIKLRNVKKMKDKQRELERKEARSIILFIIFRCYNRKEKQKEKRKKNTLWKRERNKIDTFIRKK